MATDYLLFIHGVNVRKTTYADDFFQLIQDGRGAKIHLEKAVVYWGDVSASKEEKLLALDQAAANWKQLWFRTFRETILLRFLGDIALYTSRAVGAAVVDRIWEQVRAIQEQARSEQTGDGIHLVAHSLGTIILFDVLFAPRWDEAQIPGHDSVLEIRRAIYGLYPDPGHGLHLASIHTMGSPLAFFSLMDEGETPGETQAIKDDPLRNARATPVLPEKITHTHDIMPRLQDFLARQQLKSGTLPWWSFTHPGDPLASPLESLLHVLIKEGETCLEVHDVITSTTGVLGELGAALHATHIPLLDTAALIDAVDAHTGYWLNREIARQIGAAIERSAR